MRREAFELWQAKLERAKLLEAGNPPYRDLAVAFVLWAKRKVQDGQLSGKTLECYAWFLDQFLAVHGDTPVMELAPMHVTDWIMSKSWNSSTQHGAITAVKRVLGWAFKEGRIQRNPLAGMERPRIKRRTTLIDADSHRRMVLHAGSQHGSGKIDRQIRLVLIAMRKTGCRPQDICRVQVENVDASVQTWTLMEHKRDRHTDAPKTVYLSACMQTITRILMAGRKSGPLFRGRNGQLTINAIGSRLKKLRKQLDGLPAGTVAYAYRHTFITEAMERGVPTATIAELVGTSVSMIEKHYGHLAKKQSHLIQAASQAASYGHPATHH